MYSSRYGRNRTNWFQVIVLVFLGFMLGQVVDIDLALQPRETRTEPPRTERTTRSQR